MRKDKRNLNIENKRVGLRTKLSIICIIFTLIIAGAVNATIKLGNDGTYDWSMVDTDEIRTTEGKSFPATGIGLRDAGWSLNGTGGVITVPECYLMSSNNITMEQNIYITGNGIENSKILFTKSGGCGFRFVATSGEQVGGGIYNMDIICSDPVANQGTGVYVEDIKHFEIDHCRFVKFKTQIHLNNVTYFTRITGNRFRQYSEYAIYLDGDKYGGPTSVWISENNFEGGNATVTPIAGIWNEEGTRGMISNNYFEATYDISHWIVIRKSYWHIDDCILANRATSSAILFDGGIDGAIVENTNIYRSASDGNNSVYIDGTNVTSHQHIYFENCRIYGKAKFVMSSDSNNVSLHIDKCRFEGGSEILLTLYGIDPIVTSSRFESDSVTVNAISCYADNLTFSDNTIEGGDYGLHVSGDNAIISNSHINNTYFGILGTGDNCIVDSVNVNNSEYQGIFFSSGQRNNIIISNCFVNNSVWHGIRFGTGSVDSKISDCVIRNSGKCGIYLDDVDNVNRRFSITGCIIENTTEQGIRVDRPYNGIVANNIVNDTTLSAISVDITSPYFSKVINNIGWITENSGTDTLTTTSKTVAHGLDGTPTIINICWRENPTDSVGDWWIDTIGSTNFVLNVATDPGANDLDFGWEAKIR